MKSSREFIFLLVFAIALTGVAYYYFYYRDWNVRINSLDTQITELSTEVNSVNKKITSIPVLEKEIIELENCDEFKLLRASTYYQTEILLALEEIYLKNQMDHVNSIFFKTDILVEGIMVTSYVDIMVSGDLKNISSFLADIETNVLSGRISTMKITYTDNNKFDMTATLEYVFRYVPTEDEKSVAIKAAEESAKAEKAAKAEKK